MAIEEIYRDYVATTGKELPEEIDVIGILRSGAIAADIMAERLKRIPSPKIRRLFLSPRPRDGGSSLLKRETTYNSLVSRKILPPGTTEEDFFAKPELRLFAPGDNGERIGNLTEPKPQNLVLLADDCIYKGKTMGLSLQDMKKLGYNENLIYFAEYDECDEGVWHLERFPGESHPRFFGLRKVAETIK